MLRAGSHNLPITIIYHLPLYTYLTLCQTRTVIKIVWRNKDSSTHLWTLRYVCVRLRDGLLLKIMFMWEWRTNENCVSSHCHSVFARTHSHVAQCANISCWLNPLFGLFHIPESYLYYKQIFAYFRFILLIHAETIGQVWTKLATLIVYNQDLNRTESFLCFSGNIS